MDCCSFNDLPFFSFPIAHGRLRSKFLLNLITRHQDHAQPHLACEVIFTVVCRRPHFADFSLPFVRPDQFRAAHNFNGHGHEPDYRAGSSKYEGTVGHHQAAAGAGVK
jgi:hypothetical protein